MRLAYAILTVLCFCSSFVDGNGKFQSLRCAVLRPDWGIQNECRIKAINRTQNVINLRFTLKKTITECKVNFKLLKRERGGWHPFLYAMTVDICDFFKNPRKYTIPGLIYSYIRPYTNIRYTCPYKINTEIRLTEWVLDGKSIISRFPIDFGEYGLHTTWYTNKSISAQINGSVVYTPY